MHVTGTKAFSRVMFLAALALIAGSLLVAGCSSTPKQLDPTVTAPQVIVNPDKLSLGVASVTGADIVFNGSGFEPEDMVFISLIGPGDTDVAVANATVQADGTFRAAAGSLGKVAGILQATVSGEYKDDGSYNQYVVLTRDPIPAGLYTVRATGMLSDQVAETEMLLKRPGIGDRLKDWIGKRTGKIVDRRSN